MNVKLRLEILKIIAYYDINSETEFKEIEIKEATEDDLDHMTKTVKTDEWIMDRQSIIVAFEDNTFRYAIITF